MQPSGRRTPRRRREQPGRQRPGRDPQQAARQHAVPQLRNLSIPSIDVRGWWRTAREGVASLLARPLTSFHLVLLLTVLLTGFGLMMVQSASAVEGHSKEGSAYGFFFTQSVFVGLGLAAFYVTLRLPIRLIRRFATIGVVASLVMLVLVLIPGIGVERFGARRWFEVAGFGVQPSEIAKLALCIWGAHVLAGKRATGYFGKELLPALVPVGGLMALLVLLEPNLSTATTIGIVMMALLWFANLPWHVFAAFLGALGVGFVVLALVAGYRAQRVASFLGQVDDPQGAGYQSRQALYALANGGLFGVGLGQSTAKWNYLPNAHNDFIFAIISEELGLLGGVTLIGLFALLAWVGMRIARRSVDPFLRLLTSTITVLISVQAVINIAYVVGVAPVTGIQLPLVSAGGTSTVTMLIMLGLLASAARHEPDAVVALAATRHRGVSQLLRLPRPAAYRPARTGRLGRRRADAGHGTPEPEQRRRPSGPQSPGRAVADPRRWGAADPRRRSAAEPRRRSGTEPQRRPGQEPRRRTAPEPLRRPVAESPRRGAPDSRRQAVPEPRRRGAEPPHRNRSDEIHYPARGERYAPQRPVRSEPGSGYGGDSSRGRTSGTEHRYR